MCLPPRLPDQGGLLCGQRELGQLFLTLILFHCPEWEGNEPLSRSLESHPHVPGALAWAAQPKQSLAHT